MNITEAKSIAHTIIETISCAMQESCALQESLEAAYAASKMLMGILNSLSESCIYGPSRLSIHKLSDIARHIHTIDVITYAVGAYELESCSIANEMLTLVQESLGQLNKVIFTVEA